MKFALNQDLSLLAIVLSASWVVKGVMLLLLAASLASWWIIFLKHFALKREQRRTDDFEREFWGSGDVRFLYERIKKSPERSSIEEIFRKGYAAFSSLAATAGPQHALDSARRAMQAAYQRELDALEARLSFLATVGSVSPYVGLFGTVWGIINAFRGLANVSQATLAQVAPGIAEALAATAIGLFAAIPAVVAYNRFTRDVDRLANRLEAFIEEYSILLQRQVLRS